MADSDQSAVVRELYSRRESLDPEKRSVVDELAKRLKISEPAPVEQPSATSRFLAPLDPRPLIHELTKSSGNDAEDMSGATFAKNVLGVVKGLGMEQVDMGRKAIDAYKSGNHLEAAAKGLSALVPILGPMSQHAADKFNSGDWAGGFGTVLAMGLPEVFERAPGVVRAVGDTAKAAGTAVKDTIMTPSVAKSLDRAGDYAIGGGAVGLHPVPIVMGTAAKMGAEAIRRNIAKAAPIAEEIPQIYDDIAISQAGKPFSKLRPDAQAAVKQMADRIQQQSSASGGVQAGEPVGGVVSPASAEVPQPTQSPAQPHLNSMPNQLEAEIQSTRTPEPLTKATIKPKVQSIAEQLRDAMNESGTAPTEGPEAISGKAYEADARSSKAEVVAKALHENGISYSDARNLMEVGQWKQLFKDLGQTEPGASSGNPAATIEQTLVKLKKLYDADKPAEAPKPRNIRRRTK